MTRPALRLPVPVPPDRCEDGHDFKAYDCSACEDLQGWHEAYQAWLGSDEGDRWHEMDQADQAFEEALAAVTKTAEAYLADLPRGLGVIPPVECPECGGTGTLSFTSERYGPGFGHIVETVLCPCGSLK